MQYQTIYMCCSPSLADFAPPLEIHDSSIRSSTGSHINTTLSQRDNVLYGGPQAAIGALPAREGEVVSELGPLPLFFGLAGTERHVVYTRGDRRREGCASRHSALRYCPAHSAVCQPPWPWIILQFCVNIRNAVSWVFVTSIFEVSYLVIRRVFTLITGIIVYRY